MLYNNQESTVLHLFKKETEIGTLFIYPIKLPEDAVTIHEWVNQPYAKFWDMENTKLNQVFDAYQKIIEDKHHNAYLGVLNNQPIFICESYSTLHDDIANFYDAKDTDLGMHILVGLAQKRIPNFTWNIFCFVMDFFFDYLNAERVVVEPDVNNDKIHVLNKKAGFNYLRVVQLANKKAHIALNTKENYLKAIATL